MFWNEKPCFCHIYMLVSRIKTDGFRMFRGRPPEGFLVVTSRLRSPAIHQQDEQSKILGGSSHLGSVGYIPLFFVRYFLVRRVNPIVGLQHPRNVSCTIHLDQQLSDSVPTFGIQFFVRSSKVDLGTEAARFSGSASWKNTKSGWSASDFQKFSIIFQCWFYSDFHLQKKI